MERDLLSADDADDADDADRDDADRCVASCSRSSALRTVCICVICRPMTNGLSSFRRSRPKKSIADCELQIADRMQAWQLGV